MNPKKNQVVVKYSSKSYGSLLFRSPNSPPPSPPLPPPSMAYLNYLFFNPSFRHSPSSSLLPLPQHQAPPLLPLPSSVARSFRQNQTRQKAKKNRVAVKNKVTANEKGRAESLMSPPPSSLPLPRFSLMRSKVAAADASSGKGDGGARSCIAEATNGGGGADDHELMRMLSF